VSGGIILTLASLLAARAGRAAACLAVLAALLMPGVALADGHVLRVAFNEMPPWKMRDASGTPAGPDIDFLNAVAGRMGLTVEYVELPFKRGLKMLEIGELDLMTGVLRRPEREQYLHYIQPAYKKVSDKAFFVLRGREASIVRHEDLYGLRIGTNLGGRYFPQFDDDSRIGKHPVATPELSFRMLLAERIDAVVMTESVGEYRVEQLGLSDRIGKARYVHREDQDVFLVLSKRSGFAPRLDEFSRVAAALLREQGGPIKARLSTR
jgi:polar amino acid transport system substrate-binding protein